MTPLQIVQLIQAIIGGISGLVGAADAVKDVIATFSAANGLDPIVVASTIAGDDHATIDAAVDAMIAAGFAK